MKIIMKDATGTEGTVVVTQSIQCIVLFVPVWSLKQHLQHQLEVVAKVLKLTFHFTAFLIINIMLLPVCNTQRMPFENSKMVKLGYYIAQKLLIKTQGIIKKIVYTFSQKHIIWY